MTDWWHSPQRIVQTNLRLIDASLDPEKVAADLPAFGATAMLFNVGGIYGWYPSELAAAGAQSAPRPRPRRRDDRGGPPARHQVHRPLRSFQGDEDRLRCPPRLVLRQRSGEPFEYNGTYQACVNGDWYQEQAPSVLEETLGRYEIDGLFFNMFGYLATDYSFRHYGLCHCENCKRNFRAFSGGADLPGGHQQRQSRFTALISSSRT